MAELRREEYMENGYVPYPGLLGTSQLSAFLNEIDRISDGNTLAHHDKSRLEMEPNQSPDGRLSGESTIRAVITQFSGS